MKSNSRLAPGNRFQLNGNSCRSVTRTENVLCARLKSTRLDSYSCPFSPVLPLSPFLTIPTHPTHSYKIPPNFSPLSNVPHTPLVAMITSLSHASVHPTLWETFQLGPFNPPRLWVGLWQLSSTAWGSAPASRIREAMTRHVDQGYTAFGR
jgi:hypothetical protein